MRTADDGDDSYLDAVIHEVMRLRPSVPATGRRATRDTEINGVRIPEGGYAILSIIGVHERPDVYESPLSFNPERFMDSRPGTYTWLTFGGGPHRCLGGAFALFEARTLMRTLLRSYTIRPEPGAPSKPSHPSDARAGQPRHGHAGPAALTAALAGSPTVPPLTRTPAR